jgi:hypothetical protein
MCHEKIKTKTTTTKRDFTLAILSTVFHTSVHTSSPLHQIVSSVERAQVGEG